MHELQVTQSILDMVLLYARQNNVEKVLRICDGENVHLERGRGFFIRDMEVV
jgi:predicted acetyltransferase